MMTLTEQLVLPGQTAAPEGPIDLRNMYLAHHAFRRDLAAFAKAVPVTPVEDRTAWRALAERWSMFAHVLHHHHQAEDDWLWPLLTERSDATGRATLAAMEAEHEAIDPTLEACAAGFARLADHVDDAARAALSVRLTAAREDLGRHLRHEETGALPILQEVMTVEEWEAFEKRIEATYRFREVFRLVPWMMHGLPVAAQEQVTRSAHPVQRLMWRLGRGRFERLERTAFRHLPG